MKWFWNWKPWSFSMHINRWRIICKLSRPWFMSEHSWSLGIHLHNMHSYLTYEYIQIQEIHSQEKSRYSEKDISNSNLRICKHFAPSHSLFVWAYYVNISNILYVTTVVFSYIQNDFSAAMQNTFLSYVWNFLIFHSKQWLVFLSFCW